MPEEGGADDDDAWLVCFDGYALYICVCVHIMMGLTFGTLNVVIDTQCSGGFGILVVVIDTLAVDMYWSFNLVMWFGLVDFHIWLC